MKTIKYLLLVLLCYCTAQVYSQNKASWVPDSIASQIPVIQNQAREWKQKIYENPKDEKAWMSYARTIQTLKSLTPGDDIEKEKRDTQYCYLCLDTEYDFTFWKK